MRTLAILLFAFCAGSVFGQTAEDPALGGQPLEITSTGGTSYENGIATARDNVALHIGDTDLYADAAEYNSSTHEVRLQGNVRIYRGIEFYTGERVIYNTETKAIAADTMRTINNPFFLAGDRVNTLSDTGKLIQKGTFTTHDSSQPDFRIRASTIRVYQGDRVILKNAIFYVGKVPIFYWPYLYQSLDDSSGFVATPAYMSSWGATILGRATFPIVKNVKAAIRLDYRERRGPAIGFEPDIVYGKNHTSFAKIQTYFLRDEDPTINRTAIPRGAIPEDRYRLSLLDRTNFSSDISAFAQITKLSDPYVLQDFFQSEFRLDPQPDNIISVNKYSPLYSLTAFARFQANNFFETTERLPEIALDVTRQPIFGSPIFYEGENSAGFYRRSYPNNSLYQDYDTFRVDTFHQFLYPQTYFGWLSIVPRAGFRATYYADTRDLTGVPFLSNPDALIPDFLIPAPTANDPLVPGGDRLRMIVNTGVGLRLRSRGAGKRRKAGR
jgi:LPS-assembly protein